MVLKLWLLLSIYQNFQVLQRNSKKVAPLFVDGATLLQITLEVIQYPKPTALRRQPIPHSKLSEGNSYSECRLGLFMAWTKDQCMQLSTERKKHLHTYRHFTNGKQYNDFKCNILTLLVARPCSCAFGPPSSGLPPCQGVLETNNFLFRFEPKQTETRSVLVLFRSLRNLHESVFNFRFGLF